ncbi:Ribonuclease III [hydrothermal vent metagenome]|uniref:ribonuclease III n=1 Tax=hydrothermal vent metagenome TaxID=652676 RepID=A0A3B0T933_9ZZZZ
MSPGPDAAMAAGGGLDKLQRRLGHTFADPALLGRALTHSSVDAGGGPGGSYERLEFLGDRVLGLVIAQILLEKFPHAAEGELAPRFNALVRRQTVAEIARALDIGPYLRLGAGEHQTGGRDKAAILADVGESLIAAIFLDGGLEAADRFIRAEWGSRIEQQTALPRDAKTTLQEWSQGRGLGLPEYTETDRLGPDHAPRFTIEVRVAGLAPARGVGNSKREAEQLAAQELLEREGAAGDV